MRGPDRRRQRLWPTGVVIVLLAAGCEQAGLEDIGTSILDGITDAINNLVEAGFLILLT